MDTKGGDVIISLADSEECEQMARLEFASFKADETSVIIPLMFPSNVSNEVKEQRIQDRAKGIKGDIEAIEKKKVITAKINGIIVGYANWTLPGQDDYFKPTMGGFMQRFIEQVNTTRAGILDGTRYWYLSLLAVDHTIWQRGIGRKLVQWGLDKAQQDPLCPLDVFLEAGTMAEPFYWRLGFKTLGWDNVKDKDAPDGICKWPYMIKRGNNIKVEESSLKVGLACEQDCEKLANLSHASFAVHAYTIVYRLRYPPVSQDVTNSRIKGHSESIKRQIRKGDENLFIKAEINGVIVGYAEWVPPGRDCINDPPSQAPISEPSFNQRYVGQVIKTRTNVMKGKKYWYLITLAVDPTYFGAGVGRHLVQNGLDHAKNDDSDCYLETNFNNEAFYSKLEFERLGCDRVEAKEAPDGYVDWVYMMKKAP